MKFDTIIIGGGLAGLTAAVATAERGIKTALLSAGRSSLHFNSGSLGLLGYDGDHNVVAEPLKTVSALSPEHPYSLIGADSVPALAAEAVALLQRAGIVMQGDASANHTRISPLGIDRPAWLTMENMLTAGKEMKAVAVVDIVGFLDFYPRFVAEALRREGCEVNIVEVDTPALQSLRVSATEMRVHNIARAIGGEKIPEFAAAVKAAVDGTDADTVVMPAVVTFGANGDASRMVGLIGRKTLFAPTLGVSMPGMAIHEALEHRLKALGGTILNGHRATGAEFDGQRLKAVYTDKLDGDSLMADNFILASGSFFGRGLVALPDTVKEPLLALDTYAPDDVTAWFAADMFAPQPVINAGVTVDSSFCPTKDGRKVENVFVAGSTLAHADSISEDSGAGVAMLTAIHVANLINR